MSRLISKAGDAAHYLRPKVSIFERTLSLGFRLHAGFTTGVLIVMSLLLMGTEFYGSPIQCITKLPRHLINTYCWIAGTFTMEDHWLREQGVNSAAPGIYTPEVYSQESTTHMKHHNYYQWVVIILPIMAFFFRLPLLVWRKYENRLLETITEKLGTEKARHLGVNKESQKEFVDYFVTHMITTTPYFWTYLACEIWCLVNVIIQAYSIDKFLGGEFSQYGTRVLAFTEQDQDQRIDPMILIFPRTTKCTFHKFGSSGTIETVDNYCILPQNIFNEKIFVFLWFWFIGLFFILAVTIVARILYSTSHVMRTNMLHLKCRMVPKDKIEMVCSRITIDDWWMLYNVAGFVEPKTLTGCLASIWSQTQPRGNDDDNTMRKHNNNSAEALYHTSSV